MDTTARGPRCDTQPGRAQRIAEPPRKRGMAAAPLVQHAAQAAPLPTFTQRNLTAPYWLRCPALPAPAGRAPTRRMRAAPVAERRALWLTLTRQPVAVEGGAGRAANLLLGELPRLISNLILNTGNHQHHRHECQEWPGEPRDACSFMNALSMHVSFQSSPRSSL
eukprot:361118-Chlamydomonas_euryale.AAC.7